MLKNLKFKNQARILWLAIAAFVLAACTSMTPVRRSLLEEKNLVGRWQSSDYWINIACSGAISYEVPTPIRGPVSAMAHLVSTTKTPTDRSTGGHIAELATDKIIIGSLIPITKETLHISSWPAATGSGLEMVVEGYRYRLAEIKSCED